MSSDQSGVAADQPDAAPAPAADENMNEGVRAVGDGGGTDDAVVAGAANNGIDRRGKTGEITDPAAAASGTSERLTEAADGNTRDQGAPAMRGPVHAGEPAAMRNLPNRSEVTGEGHPYVPDLNAPNSRFLPKEYETRVEVIQKIPEMKTVEETVFVKEITYEERMVTVPRTKVIMEETVIIDRVPIIKQVPKKRIEIVHRVVEEPREITEMVDVVDYMEVPRVEKTPRIITEDVLESVHVPIVREVPVKRQIEVHTGNYIEKLHNRYSAPGDMNLLRNLEQKHRPHLDNLLAAGHHQRDTSSDSSADAESDQQHHHSIDTVTNNNNGTSARTAPPPATAAASSANGGAPAAAAAGRQPRKQGLFKRIENKFTAA
ncbi:unnamed protein product [Sphagnum jensenii]|uniref:Uncharacterized protein n=1 Tax=Sphagnum jensenii TaxID=128206 RepID=A0ABP0XHU7_9BRYO